MIQLEIAQVLGLVLFMTKVARIAIRASAYFLGGKSASTPSISVDLSVSEKVKSLSAEPPINIEVVNEIKQKVSEGRYPIDLNAISNKLFESIKEGEG